MSVKCTIFCYGGCGRSVTLRKSKIHPADYYLCHSRESGIECEKKLPPLSFGMTRSIDIYAASSFWGYTYEIAGKEILESIVKAKEIHATGVVKLAIEKAKKQN